MRRRERRKFSFFKCHDVGTAWPYPTPKRHRLLGCFSAQGSTILSDQTQRRDYTDVLQRELPPGVDPHDVSIHNIGALQKLLAEWDQLENELAAACTDAASREGQAQDDIILAGTKFEEIQRHIDFELSDAKRRKNRAVSDKKIATQKLNRVTSSKITILGLLRSMGNSAR
jgi:hypothetical protein